jgi:hypothetical protein
MIAKTVQIDASSLSIGGVNTIHKAYKNTDLFLDIH